jgi:hypothetical protein
LLYTGSDDGFVHVSKNGGGSWDKISASFPKDLWVSRVVASSHKKERVYVSLNGYRFDDFTPYIFMSDDYGQTWKNIGSTLPIAAVNVIKEDPENENVLYVGTDNGLYFSFTRGNSWQAFSKNLPKVAVHDLVVQPTAKHLIIGTHGRSIYKANIAPLQTFTDEIAAKSVHVFAIKSIKKSGYWGSSWSKWFKGNTPEISFPFYVNSSRTIKVDIFSDTIKVNSISMKAVKGFNEVIYDVSFSDKGKSIFKKINTETEIKKAKNNLYYLPKGKYTVKIEEATSVFEVK